MSEVSKKKIISNFRVLNRHNPSENLGINHHLVFIGSNHKIHLCGPPELLGRDLIKIPASTSGVKLPRSRPTGPLRAISVLGPVDRDRADPLRARPSRWYG